MTAHLSDEQIRAYRARSLAATELLRVSEHIVGCESCRARIVSPAEAAARVRAVRALLHEETGPVHLSYEQIETYVDGTMGRDDTSTVEAHARECRSCAADLSEIGGLRRELEVSRVVRGAASRWDNIWKAVLSWRGGLVLAGAACAALAFVLVRAPAPQNGNVAEVNQAKTGGSATPAETGSVIKDGTRVISVAAGGRITGLEALAGSERVYLEQALAEKRIEPAASLANLAANRGVLLGAPGEPARGKLLGPVATVVESQQPVFRWQPIAGATYRVSVYTTGYDLVASSGWVSGMDWQIPKPLRRGMRYSWQLTVRQTGTEFTVPTPPAPEARFQVLAETDEAEISQLRNRWGTSHLVLGIFYARAGLLDEAQRELRALRDQNPGSEGIASLLASVERLQVGGKP